MPYNNTSKAGRGPDPHTHNIHNTPELGLIANHDFLIKKVDIKKYAMVNYFDTEHEGDWTYRIYSERKTASNKTNAVSYHHRMLSSIF